MTYVLGFFGVCFVIVLLGAIYLASCDDDPFDGYDDD